jgi:hypothetical protein
VVAERLDDLAVGKLEQAVALFNQRDANAEHGEHAGVFDADHAAAHHNEGPGQYRQIENLVAVDNGAAVDGTLGESAGLVPTAMMMRSASRVVSVCGPSTRTWFGIDEAGDAVNHVDAVARKLRLGHVDLGLDHGLHAEGEVGHGDLFLHPVVHAVERAVVVAGKMHHGFAHGLRGDGAGVDADAADHGASLDHGHALLHFGGGDGGPLPGRPGTDDDQVILDGAHARSLQGSMRRGRLAASTGCGNKSSTGGYHSAGLPEKGSLCEL